MIPGVYVSPYFIFRNFPEVDIIRVGGMELVKNDPGPYSPSLWDYQRLITDIDRENGKQVVYLGRATKGRDAITARLQAFYLGRTDAVPVPQYERGDLP